MPGFDRSTKEIVRTFAVTGTKPVPESVSSLRAGAKSTTRRPPRVKRRVPDAQCIAMSTRRCGISARSGFQRKSRRDRLLLGRTPGYIVACNLEIDAAVDCYGGRVVVGATS